MTHGPNYTLKISREVNSVEEVATNFIEGLTNTIPHIMKWGVDLEDLKTISIKGTNTVDLPIFNQLSEEEIKIYFSNVVEN